MYWVTFEYDPVGLKDVESPKMDESWEPRWHATPAGYLALTVVADVADIRSAASYAAMAASNAFSRLGQAGEPVSMYVSAVAPDVDLPEIVGTKTVASMIGASTTRVKQLAPKLGGYQESPGSHWVFTTRTVRAKLDQRAKTGTW